MSKLNYFTALAISGFVGAQPVAVAENSSDGHRASLDEITVTAQRRSANVQDISIAIQTYSGEALADTGVTNTDYISQVVPGFQTGRQLGGSTPFIRGIGSQSTVSGDEASVASYVDGVYMATMNGNDIRFNNVERIEVLKGPQGTLYGRNATGGLVHIVTKTPSHDPSGQIGVSYGNYDTFTSELYATGGISEFVAADVAFSYKNQGDGYGTNLVTGSDVNYSDYIAVRSKWLITPSDALKITLIGDYAKREGDIGIVRAPVEGTLGIDGALIFQGCLRSGAPVAACQSAAINGATKAPGDSQDISANIDSYSETKQTGISAKIEYSLDWADIVSITAYREYDAFDLLDQDATPFSVVEAILPRDDNQFSQEIQLLSNGDGPLSWITGLYYLKFEPSFDPFELQGGGLALLAPGLTALHQPVTQDTTSYSAFAHVAYDVNERLTLSAAGRITKDKREINGNTMFTFGAVNVDSPYSASESWVEPTYRIAIEYHATDDVFLYGTFSTGFKSGVFNSVVTNGILEPPVDPETVDAYEVGFKSNLAGDQVRLNGAAFYYDYQDLQLVAISAGTPTLSNASDAKVSGAELDLDWAITDNFEVRVGLSYLDAEYEQYACVFTTPTGIGGNARTPGSCEGHDMIRAPDFTGNVGATYVIPTDAGVFEASVNWYYNDGFFWEPDNRYKEPSYDVLNAQVSWTILDRKLRVRAFGGNLTDSQYSPYANTEQFGDLHAIAPPRTWGVGVDYYWK